MGSKLMDKYLEFVSYQQSYLGNGVIDASRTSFFTPTNLLPFLNLTYELLDDARALGFTGNDAIQYVTNKVIPPRNESWNYVLHVLRHDLASSKHKSFIPPVIIPKDEKESQKLLDRYMKLHHEYFKVNYAAYALIIQELVDNIHQHSKFNFAVTMAQSYRNSLELGFFDNGITIAKSYEKIGRVYSASKHHEAIKDALNGDSSKNENERGFGLRSSMNLATKAMRGEALIVSGSGAAIIKPDSISFYPLSHEKSLNGTLITLLLPKNTSKIDIYPYLY